jgi:hypothetical protein
MPLNNKNYNIIILMLIIGGLFLSHQVYKINRRLDALVVEGMDTPKMSNQEAHSILTSMYNNEGTLTVDNLVVTNKAAIGKDLTVGEGYVPTDSSDKGGSFFVFKPKGVKSGAKTGFYDGKWQTYTEDGKSDWNFAKDGTQVGTDLIVHKNATVKEGMEIGKDLSVGEFNIRDNRIGTKRYNMDLVFGEKDKPGTNSWLYLYEYDKNVYTGLNYFHGGFAGKHIFSEIAGPDGGRYLHQMDKYG